MKSAIFIFYVVFCIASVEDLQSKKSESSIEVNTEVYAPVVDEHAGTSAEKRHSPVLAVPDTLDVDKAVVKHSELDNKSISPLTDAHSWFPMTIVTNMSRNVSVLNLENNFSNEEVVNKLMEILENLDEEFGSVRKKLKDVKLMMMKLRMCLEQLSDLRLEETKMKKKNKKLNKKISEVEGECYYILRNSRDILNDIEAKVRGINEKIDLMSNRCQMFELLFLAEYRRLNKNLDTLNRDHDKCKLDLQEMSVESREAELQRTFKRNMKPDEIPLLKIN